MNSKNKLPKITGILPFEDDISCLYNKGNYSIFKIAVELKITIPNVVAVLSKHNYFIPTKEYKDT